MEVIFWPRLRHPAIAALAGLWPRMDVQIGAGATSGQSVAQNLNSFRQPETKRDEEAVRMVRLIAGILGGLGLLVSAHVASAATYYVNASTGDDSRTCNQAQDPSTPRRTIGNGSGGGVFCAFPGDIVSVASGTYAESVESKRDGSSGAPIVIRSAVAGGAIVQAPAGANGMFIDHSHVTVDGFTVNGGGQSGLAAGPHDGTNGPVVGLLIQNNTFSNNAGNGIKIKSGLNTEIAFNTIFNNGQNGISYSGNTSVIHDNVVHHNGQFGIYVKDGVDHQVYDNTVNSNTGGNLQILGTTIPSPIQTYYVDCVNGDDARTVTQAKNPATPWRTVKTGLLVADAGDTVLILGGTVQSPVTCPETTLESKRDGTTGKPITIKAAVPWGVIVDPPSGHGFVITHNYHTLEGLIVTGAVTGVQMGPHDAGDGPVTGLIASQLQVY